MPSYFFFVFIISNMILVTYSFCLCALVPCNVYLALAINFIFPHTFLLSIIFVNIYYHWYLRVSFVQFWFLLAFTVEISLLESDFSRHHHYSILPIDVSQWIYIELERYILQKVKTSIKYHKCYGLKAFFRRGEISHINFVSD